MSDRAALLRHIIEHPDDDNARLVMADWFDENGEPERAEFVRLQVAIAQEDMAVDDGLPPTVTTLSQDQPSPDPARQTRMQRMEDLCLPHLYEWTADLPRWARFPQNFRRGFIAAVRASARDWLAQVEPLHAATPIDTLTLLGANDVVPRVVVQPELARVTDLTFSVHDFNRQAGYALTEWSGCRSLRALRIRTLDHPYDLNGLLAVARADWPALLALHLETRTSVTVITQLAGNATLGSLRGLTMNCETATPQAIEMLANSTCLKRLASLTLSSLGDGDRVLTLIRSPGLAALRELHLPGSGLSTDTVRRLANEPGLARLRRLTLASDRMDDASVVALAQSAHTTGLRTLDLSCVQITEVAALALAASPYLGGLESLSLWRAISERGRAALRERYRDRVQC